MSEVLLNYIGYFLSIIYYALLHVSVLIDTVASWAYCSIRRLECNPSGQYRIHETVNRISVGHCHGHCIFGFGMILTGSDFINQTQKTRYDSGSKYLNPKPNFKKNWIRIRHTRKKKTSDRTTVWIPSDRVMVLNFFSQYLIIREATKNVFGGPGGGGGLKVGQLRKNHLFLKVEKKKFRKKKKCGH